MSLRNKDREWIQHETQKSEGARRQKNWRIRSKALRMLVDLQFLAENLNESELQQLFNSEKLIPLFNAIFQISATSSVTHDTPSGVVRDTVIGSKVLNEQDVKNLEKRRRRLLDLSCRIIDRIGYSDFAQTIAPSLYGMLIKQGILRGIMLGINAVYLARSYDVSVVKR